MDRVAIVTESTVCLPQGLVTEYGIHIVPMEFSYEGKTYRDGIDLTPSQFYELLAQAKKLPTTSPGPPGSYLEAYREASQHAQSILCITLSPKFSTTHNSALLAKETAKEVLPQATIEVLDSGTAAGAQGWIVLAAARAAKARASLAEVMDAARSLMPRVHLVALLDTLYFLVKGGRVPLVAAWATSLLNIKPVFELVPLQAEARMLHRARGRRQALERLLQVLQDKTQGDGPLHALVMHTNIPGEAEGLRERIAAQFDCAELYITDFTPVIGVHCGPGLLGVAFYMEAGPGHPKDQALTSAPQSAIK
ncbi:MAG TPA: DegV family protein [Dehalococcoidia bacterium]|nr:DegV family protein [Dehalococcoidia bacterium]